TNCGTQVKEGAAFCVHCGTKVETGAEVNGQSVSQPAVQPAETAPPQPPLSVPPVPAAHQRAPVQSFVNSPYQVPLQQINITVPQSPAAVSRSKWETPRVVTGIIAIVLTFWLWAVSCGTTAAGTLELSPEMISIGASGAVMSFLWLSAGIVSIACRKSKGGSIAAGILYAVFFFIMIKGDYSDEGTAAMLCFVFLSFVFAALMIISGIAQKKQA
ncbi:MAG: zinc ribbon domain-containing protein, partial [Spirochaetaceae bacterium]|nr:zinc ribbon domain-containing protein [Spirochaetaceae bacterium]